MRKIIICIFLVLTFICSCSERNETAVDWFNKAVKLCKGGECTDPKRAVKYLNNAIKLNPNYVDAYGIRGDIYENLRQYQRAIEDFNQEIRLKPNAEIYYTRGTTYFKLNNYQRAIEDFSETIRLQPNNADAYKNRGVTYKLLLQYQRAIEDFNKVISLKPDNDEAYQWRGGVILSRATKSLAALMRKKPVI